MYFTYIYYLCSRNQKYYKSMEQKLQLIAEHLERINRDLQNEGQVWDAEMKDRIAKGLEGEAAIEHYNQWMKAAGMEHLMTK